MQQTLVVESVLEDLDSDLIVDLDLLHKDSDLNTDWNILKITLL